MWIIRLALKRPYTFVVAALLLLLMTPVVLTRTPTDTLPSTNIPVVSVVWSYTGLTASDIESLRGNRQASAARYIFGGTQILSALSNAPPEVSIALKGFFAVVELLIIAAGVYVFRNREKLFGYRGKEGDTYASANLRLAMVVLIWVHSVIVAAIMIFEV